MRVLFVSFLFLASAALAADVIGEYHGTYTGSDGSQGKIRTMISKGTDAPYACKFFFTADGDKEIEAKNTSCVVDGSKVSAEYEATVGDSPLKITTEGVLAADNSLSGTYKTATPTGEPAGSGTWKTSPKQ